MDTASTDITVDRSADDVWAIVGDFGGLAWMPGIESCEVDGDVRKIGMGGIEVLEKLINRDAAARTLTYSIIDGPVPVDSHEATITVTPEGDGSRVTYDIRTEPDGTAAFFADVYAGALKAVKAQAEG